MSGATVTVHVLGIVTHKSLWPDERRISMARHAKRTKKGRKSGRKSARK